MKKGYLKSAICVVLLGIYCFSAAFALGETQLYLGGSDKSSAEYKAFVNAHPEITVQTETNIYLSTDEIINAFLTGEFPFDTFVMTSSSFDIQLLMSKGYCSPLSDSEVLRAELDQMYSPIQNLVSRDGAIYGAPFFCYISYYAYRPEAWKAAGLSDDDIPTSFEEYLDFLEKWVAHIRENPEDEISVSNLFDSDLYGEHSYISYLVDLLISNYIMQSDHAGEPLRFDTPIFRELLARCQSVGADLYKYEPEQKGNLGLFEEQHGMRELKHLIPLRLTTEQPILIKASLYTAFLNSRCEYPVLATEYLENCVTCIEPQDAAYLYRDALPVEDPDYRLAMDKVQAEIDRLEKGLTADNLEPSERNLLQDQMAQKQLVWDEMAASEARYLISENDLALYRSYGENLYFQPPSIFDPSTEDGKNLRQLRDRFCTGRISAEQFISELDRLAWMLEMERE